MKKLAFLLAVMMMFSLLLAGCNGTTNSSAPESTPTSGGGESTPVDSDNPYANIDQSEEQNVGMYVTATQPNAM